MSRTYNAIRNLYSGIMYKFIVIIFPFIIKSVIIKQFGTEYLGLSNLFTSILQVLNLAELGFNSAIIFFMYEPIANKDEDMICRLLNLYKKIYTIIGSIILLVGLTLLPFLKLLIKGSYPEDINIYVLYILYLLNTCLSYFLFSYKSALLTAHQRNDIINKVQTCTLLVQNILQILILVIFHNYYLFMIIQIFTTLFNNIVVSYITTKIYPNYICKGKVDSKIQRKISEKVRGLMINKVCQTSRNSLDSIFISVFLGLTTVGLYSNYYSIMYAVISFLSIITTSIIAGIGNSIVTETETKNYNDMNKLNFMYMWFSGWCTICLLCLYQPFMELWMGKSYMLSNSIVILFCIYFYSLKMGDIRAAYSDAIGLWYENRFRAILETIANVVLNILLVKILGLAGIIIGTLISLLVINFGYGSQILFKNYFKNQSAKKYYLDHLKYALITVLISIISYSLCSIISINAIYNLLIRMIICLIVPNILYVLIYRKSKYFIFAKNKLFNVFKMMKKRKVN